MQEVLPPQLVADLKDCQRISVLDGDITRENFGLDDQTVAGLRKRVSIFIHAASSISLHNSLSNMAWSVVYPSLAAAKLALSFAYLERFVFVSTAYVNGFLHWHGNPANGAKLQDCVVEERIYPLRDLDHGAAVELHNIVDFGTTPEHSHMRHPFAYSYAKHLTERLLLEAFLKEDREQQLLLFRPSCFGPAQQEPFPHFEVAGSSPVTTAMCAIFSSPSLKARCASNLADPSKSTIDEVPVDVVVNRLVAHIAFGTSGCVHAVSGASGRRSFPDMYNAIVSLRRFWWWRPELRWCEDTPDLGEICALSKLYKVLGCSYLFREEETERVWQLMSPSMRQKWPLWTARDPQDMSDFAIRGQTSGEMLSKWMERKYGRPGRWMAKAMRPRS